MRPSNLQLVAADFLATATLSVSKASLLQAVLLLPFSRVRSESPVNDVDVDDVMLVAWVECFIVASSTS